MVVIDVHTHISKKGYIPNEIVKMIVEDAAKRTGIAPEKITRNFYTPTVFYDPNVFLEATGQPLTFKMSHKGWVDTINSLNVETKLKKKLLGENAEKILKL